MNTHYLHINFIANTKLYFQCIFYKIQFATFGMALERLKGRKDHSYQALFTIEN